MDENPLPVRTYSEGKILGTLKTMNAKQKKEFNLTGRVPLPTGMDDDGDDETNEEGRGIEGFFLDIAIITYVDVYFDRGGGNWEYQGSRIRDVSYHTVYQKNNPRGYSNVFNNPNFRHVTGSNSNYTGNLETQNRVPERVDKLVLTVSPDKPIADMNNFLKCFSSSSGAKFTLYVTEPNPGLGDTHNGSAVGHTFISITQGNNTATFGFYPATDDIYPIVNPSDPSEMGEDGGTPYSASISTSVSSSQLQSILNLAKNHKKNYHLDTYNCTDFGIEAGNMAGLGLPAANGSWPGGGGSNPGTLGVHIRGRSSNSNQAINKTGGNGAQTKKGC